MNLFTPYKWCLIWVIVLIVWLTHTISAQTDPLPLIGFVINDMTIAYYPRGMTAQQLMKQHTWLQAAMNASYFGWKDRGFVPAGLFMSGWVQISPFVPPSLDANLGVLMRWNHWQTPELIDIGDSIDRLVLTGNVVQIWPRLIQDGTINPVLTTSYSHRQRRTRRTFLMQQTINGVTRTIIGISRNRVTLDELAQEIQTLCTSSCQAVNLDGGSSSSLKTQYYQFRAHRYLPLRFLIH
jgi:uncharacterized protein YigE (DUF2233 family)